MIELCGKGYGEGEIIEYGLKYSELLRGAAYFCKLTGRLKVENINRFTKLAKMDKSYFWTMGLIGEISIQMELKLGSMGCQ